MKRSTHAQATGRQTGTASRPTLQSGLRSRGAFCFCAGNFVEANGGRKGRLWDDSAPSNRHPSRTCMRGTGRRNGIWHRAIADRIASSSVCWLPQEPLGIAGKAVATVAPHPGSIV